MTNGAPQYKPITQQEFDAKLKLHEEWLGLSEEEQQKQPDKRLVLKNYDLRPLQLNFISLFRATLSGCNFQGMELCDINFNDANLQNSHFQGANLRESSFIHADLRGTHLSKADLYDSDLMNTNLEGADVELVNFIRAREKKVSQIKQAKNWDKAVYRDFFREKLGISDEACREVLERYVDWEMEKLDDQMDHPKYPSVRDVFRQKKLESLMQDCGLKK